MGGLGGSFAAASTKGGYAFAFVTGTMGAGAAGAAVENVVSLLLWAAALE